MIPVYRKIRKKMAGDNRPIKYMRYAFGEILLVVVGILIALQINNWNEGRKIRAQEYKILASIQSELRSSKKELDKGLKYNIEQGKRLRKMAKYIEDDLPYNTELDTVFRTLSNWFSPYFSYTSYETLKIRGVNLIQNQDIREKIVQTYERSFSYITKDWDQFTWVYAQSVSIPITNKYVRRKLTNHLAQPNDFEQLKENVEFNNMLHHLIIDKENATKMFSHFSASLDTLILDIDNELYSKK